MFISTEDYLYRITHALEHVVAPLIESEYGRGQLLAAVFLLDQLTDRIDYKADIIKQEIETNCEAIRKVVDVVEKKAGEVPRDLKVFLDEIDGGAFVQDLAFRTRCDEMLCMAIDSYFSNRDRFDSASAHEMEDLLLGSLTQIASRDLGMFKPSTSQKLLQPKDSS